MISIILDCLKINLDTQYIMYMYDSMNHDSNFTKISKTMY